MCSSDLERGTPRLSSADIARAEAMTADGGLRRDWRASHIALRILIERWLGPEVRAKPFSIRPGGRPELDGAPISFSLSHTGGLALIALASVGPIGADLERLRRIGIDGPRRAGLIEEARRMAPDLAFAEAGDDARFLQAWVRLEAVAKASGEGMGRVLTAAGVFGSKPDQPARRAASQAPAAFSVRALHAGEGVFAAVAAPKLPATLEIVPFPADDLGLSAVLRQGR